MTKEKTNSLCLVVAASQSPFIRALGGSSGLNIVLWKLNSKKYDQLYKYGLGCFTLQTRLI